MLHAKECRDIQVDYELQKWKSENEREGEWSWLETTIWETSGKRDSVKLVGGSGISKKYTGKIEKLHDQKGRGMLSKKWAERGTSIPAAF